MNLQFTLRTVPEVPLEAECICPDRLAGLSAREIERQTLFHGNRQVPLGEFFSVAGQPGDTIEVRGDLGRVKHIGAGMTRGTLRVDGNVGAHLGAGMSGGSISVSGNAGDWVGPEMRGGRIEIHGNAGHLVGSAYRGAAVGMLGGEILVHGNALNEIGHAMRAGVIAIGGHCGDFAGVNMLAGTLVVFGALGIRAGAGMKRGTIVAMQAPEILPTFTYACTYRPAFLTLYLRQLQARGLPVLREHLDAAYNRWCGDAVELNRGEILSPAT